MHQKRAQFSSKNLPILRHDELPHLHASLPPPALCASISNHSTQLDRPSPFERTFLDVAVVLWKIRVPFLVYFASNQVMLMPWFSACQELLKSGAEQQSTNISDGAKSRTPVLPFRLTFEPVRFLEQNRK